MEIYTDKKYFEITDELHASHGQRIVNAIIDRLVFYIIMLGFGVVLGIVSELTGWYGLLDYFANVSTLEDFIISTLLILIYYIIFESLSGRTVGKYITKTIVVHEDGSKPKFDVILKRSFCRIIPFDAFSYLGSPSRGWHDTIPDVYVVKKDLFEEALKQFREFEEIGKIGENE